MPRKVENKQMIGIRISITRYISDDPQPGIVECELTDVEGTKHCFIEKTAIVTAAYIDATSDYPRPGVIACEILDRRFDKTGEEIVEVTTERPWYMETTTGLARFKVAPKQLIEWPTPSSPMP